MEQEVRHFRVGWLIDGGGGPIEHDVLISVAAGRIDAIAAYRPGDPPAAGATVDLSGCVVLPPFVDAHAHLCMSGSIDPEVRRRQREAEYDEVAPVIANHLRDLFSHGVLAVRDGGDRLGAVPRYLDQREDQVPVLVATPGFALHRRNRYGSLIGTGAAADESAVELFTRLDQRTGLVKVVNSGLNSLTAFGAETAPQFSAAELTGLVVEAKARGCRVMVHANGREAVEMAVRAGCDSIEHGYFIDTETIQLMADRGTYWVPTLFTMKALAQYADFSGGAADRSVVEKTLARQLEQVAAARERGVRIALGTDSGSIGVLHGESLVEEMKLLQRAGFSLSAAVHCATGQGARLLGVESELGRIEVGKPAHFLVSRGTPAQLPRKLSYLEAIYHHGSPSPAYRKNPDFHRRATG